MTRPLIVGISGASGALYGIRMLEALRAAGRETHLVVSRAGQRTIAEETGRDIKEIRALADVWYPVEDIGAAIASGSMRTAGMIVAPCSIRSAAEIASGNTTTLLTRAADVILKERRRLVLMLRETPLHTGHLRMLTHLSEIGAIIAPPVPAFYARPATLDDMVAHSVGRVLDLLDIDNRRGEAMAGGGIGGRSIDIGAHIIPAKSGFALRSADRSPGLAGCAPTPAPPPHTAPPPPRSRR